MRVLVVGAGLYGSVCAFELHKAGHQVQVIDRRGHVGGNMFTRWDPETQVHEHVYGAHIFHTSNKKLWDYVTALGEFNTFTNRVKTRYRGRLYSFPINLFTLYQVFDAQNPDQAQNTLLEQRVLCENPQNLEEYALAQVGPDLYQTFIEGYTTKQWGCHPRELPAEIIKRLPVRLNFDDNYYTDTYQGIPVNGYTALFNTLLARVPVALNTEFTPDMVGRNDLTIYTGGMDMFFGQELGPLPYRSLRFEREVHDTPDYQGCAVVNYPDAKVPWTRVIEHAHFNPELKVTRTKTLLTREFPQSCASGDTPYYPVDTPANRELYDRYRKLAAELKSKVHFGGRLGEYRYQDMHQVLASALVFCKKLIEGELQND